MGSIEQYPKIILEYGLRSDEKHATEMFVEAGNEYSSLYLPDEEDFVLAVHTNTSPFIAYGRTVVRPRYIKESEVRTNEQLGKEADCMREDIERILGNKGLALMADKRYAGIQILGKPLDRE
jgi:hypothetical protein